MDLIVENINEYNFVHEFVLQKESRSADLDLKPASYSKLKKVYELCRERIPESIPIIIQKPTIQECDMLLENDEKDLGAFDESIFITDEGLSLWNEIQQLVNSKNLKLQQRFPLRRKHIELQEYSKKLGQVFDPFRYKLKKEKLEKQKELK